MLLPTGVARRAAIGAPLTMVVLALVAACGGGSSNSMSGGGVAGAQKTVRGTKVIATETEYKIVLSRTRLTPGTTTFVATNQGHVAHSLEVDGPGVSDRRIPGTIPPGSSKELTVTLKKGGYEVYCPVDSHKKLGMLTHVTVGGGTNTSTGSSNPKSSWG